MKIGIDIDGVLEDIERFICDYGTKFCMDNHIPIKINYGNYDEMKTFGWNKEQKNKFWNTYLEYYIQNYSPREFASEAIQKLSQNNEIYIITARNEDGLSEASCGKMQEFTQKWLKDNNILFDKLIFKNDKDKLTYCLENGIEIMIEDSPENIEYMSKKMQVMCFNCGYNRKIEGENIIRVYSWYDVLEKICQKDENSV